MFKNDTNCNLADSGERWWYKVEEWWLKVIVHLVILFQVHIVVVVK